MTYTTIAQTINRQLDELLIAHGVNKNTFFATRFFITRKVCQLNGRFLKKQGDDATWNGVIDLYREAIGTIDQVLNLYDADVIETAQRYIDPIIQLAVKLTEAEYGDDLSALDMVLRDLVQYNNLHTYKVMAKEINTDAADAIVRPMQEGFATAVNAELTIANAA